MWTAHRLGDAAGAVVRVKRDDFLDGCRG